MHMRNDINNLNVFFGKSQTKSSPCAASEYSEIVVGKLICFNSKPLHVLKTSRIIRVYPGLILHCGYFGGLQFARGASPRPHSHEIKFFAFLLYIIKFCFECAARGWAPEFWLKMVRDFSISLPVCAKLWSSIIEIKMFMLNCIIRSQLSDGSIQLLFIVDSLFYYLLKYKKKL